MANILKQIVEQEANDYIQKRFIVQYVDDATNEDKQEIVNYEDLTTEEKATYDAFVSLASSKMV